MVGWVLSAVHGDVICLPLSAVNSAGADAGISLVSRIIVVGGEEKAVFSFAGSIVPRNEACRVGADVGAKVGIGGFISSSRDATTAAGGVGLFEINPVWMHEAVIAPVVVIKAATMIAEDCTLTAFV